MKWQAVHFFESEDGLSRNDPVEMAACLDYERALESRRLVEFVSSLAAAPNEKQRLIATALTLPSRFVSLRFDSIDPAQAFRTYEDAESFPPIPAVCVAASWFPKHWLEVDAGQRCAVVDQVRLLYPIDRFVAVPFPLDLEESSSLIEQAKADAKTLYVIAIDHTEPRSAIVRKLRVGLDNRRLTARDPVEGK